MAKRIRTWSEEKIKRYIKEGRGSGKGKEYKPWINNQSFPSEGRTSRISGWKTHRVHHLASDNEARYFYILEWSDIVTDIREQYPLLDYEETVSIAEDLGIKHPRDNDSGVPYVLSTDFLVTVMTNSEEQYLARTVKPASFLEQPRVIEKFEIERRYWEKRNIDWAIVTEKDISKQFARNVEWVHSAYKLEDSYGLSIKQVEIIASIIKEKVVNSDLSFTEISDYIDVEMNLDEGTSLFVIKHLIARKNIEIEMDKKINLNQSARLIVKKL
ncbi:TnsA endonuclease N-terminal domain-containing protein [Clostridium sp. DJ247]|uniref:TnsA endonuclease N-terminal domain-containing protein n=1 Tax=Clostridium sp. DJ247 TaxID=2726188 RepID=UPI001626094C|nr:TnsA endonuclease N-terminal domain-containing protein [Clostridium sp. DJ247]MBC2579590.1 heteromeric transposase endonuclease subunit TnsA [Clostridium sp. DJ247]